MYVVTGAGGQQAAGSGRTYVVAGAAAVGAVGAVGGAAAVQAPVRAACARPPARVRQWTPRCTFTGELCS